MSDLPTLFAFEEKYSLWLYENAAPPATLEVEELVKRKGAARGVIVYGAMNPWGKGCTIKYLFLAIQTTRQNQIRRIVIVLRDRLILPSIFFPHF